VIRLTAEFYRGAEDTETVELAVPDKLWMMAADRLAFERQFHTSSAVMAAWAELYDDKGRPLPGADLGEVREEYLYYFAFRAFKRGLNGSTPATFEDFSDALVSLDINTRELEAAPAVDAENPTAPAPPPDS
jgi:hypothetical protein